MELELITVEAGVKLEGKDDPNRAILELFFTLRVEDWVEVGTMPAQVWTKIKIEDMIKRKIDMWR
jgi:hypothetical protein